MEESILLQELETLAEALRIEVRYDAFEGRGGLCRYGGKTYLILNDELAVGERVEAFCRALARLPLDDCDAAAALGAFNVARVGAEFDDMAAVAATVRALLAPGGRVRVAEADEALVDAFGDAGLRRTGAAAFEVAQAPALPAVRKSKFRGYSVSG